jgi:hypothetical protein
VTLDEVEAKRLALTTEVASKLTEGKPQEWVVPLLWHQGRLVTGPKLTLYPTRYDDDDVKKLIKKARDLAEALSIYGHIEAHYGLPVPEVDDASTALEELIECLESQLRPPRRGGPTPDGRRRVCAVVCAYVWCRQQRKAEPHSRKLQEACEEYWKACGHTETGKPGGGNAARNWVEFIAECANDVLVIHSRHIALEVTTSNFRKLEGELAAQPLDEFIEVLEVEATPSRCRCAGNLNHETRS